MLIEAHTHTLELHEAYMEQTSPDKGHLQQHLLVLSQLQLR